MSASKHRLYFLLQRAAHVLKKEADAALSEAGGMTTSQAAVLAILRSEGPSTQRFLADKLQQRESAITTMADRLLKAGYVTRARSPTDGRAWLLAMTETGHDALEAIREPFQAINAELDQAFPNKDMDTLARGLTQIIDQLNKSKP
ncbi:MarR family transcriptional regulator [Hyphomonas sp. FCG-A18]|uniref:MarR family winged helix-turn-helix transcriptional regulator n=1 Tax=Hyphomonas sp. FCG-A18 TaxID=3080019 RepID=UPI002B2D865F|nr:MarR family transcriptional regulator [Hyphomonas sp. FCG-A18]